MVLGRSTVAAGVVALLAAVPTLAVVPTAAAAGPAPGDVVIVELPPDVRAQPRYFQVFGRTDDGHVAVRRERDSTSWSAGDSTSVILAPDGTEQVLDASVDGVVGSRLIRELGYEPSSIDHRLPGEPGWSTIDLPAGASFLDYTVDGVLITSGPPANRSMDLLPWDGGPAVGLPGVPAGGSVYRLTDPTRDGSLVLLGAAGPDGNGFYLLVDTASRQAWSLGSLEDDCPYAEARGINDGKLVWMSARASSRNVCSLDLPTPGDGALGPVTTRPIPTLPFQYGEVDVLPVGDDVLVFSSHAAGGPGWGGGEPQQPLLAIAPDGSTRSFAPWAYAVLPAADGHVLAVTGEVPGLARLTDIEVTSGDSTEVLPVSPFPAWRAGIAIDGDRVLYADNSGYLDAARERRVDFDARTATDSTLLDTGVDGSVAAGGGSIVWGKSSGSSGVRLASDGTRGAAIGGAVETDDRWSRAYWGPVHSTTGRSYPWSRFKDGALQDGVGYAAGVQVPRGPQGSVIATDLDSGETESIAVPGCRIVTRVDVAGSWMLVRCLDAAGDGVRKVVDRTGAIATWHLETTETVYLGNGFAVARTGAGELTWTALTGPTARWQHLGTTAEPDSPDWDVAVSRGPEPTVAWLSGPDAYAARLPVATSPLPAHPVGVLPPTPLSGVTVTSVEDAAWVRWHRPPAAEMVTGYEITATATTPGAGHQQQIVMADATKVEVAVPGLDNGYSYRIAVRAYNIAGSTTTDVAELARPILGPAAPTDVRVTIDRRAGRATVTWTYAQDPDRAPVEYFRVGHDGAAEEIVPADARSLTFVIPRASTSRVQVMAHANGGDSDLGLSPLTDFPYDPSPPPPAPSFPERMPPVVRLSVPPSVLLGSAVTLATTAIDNQELAERPIDVRWRTAGAGSRLGAWQAPSSWRSMPTGSLRVALKAGHTACFQARAHDRAGNVSSWSEPRCTVAAIDDRALTTSGPVRRVSGTGYFRGGASALRGSSSMRLPFTGVARGGWLLARTCPACGRVTVRVGATRLGTVNLRSGAVHARRLLPIPWSGTRRGKLSLTAVRGSGDVVIDGVALRAP